MAKTTLSEKFQIVIPKEVRTRMNLTKGETITVQSIDARYALIMKQPKSVVDTLEGLGKGIWKKLGGTEKYIEQERNSWEK